MRSDFMEKMQPPAFLKVCAHVRVSVIDQSEAEFVPVSSCRVLQVNQRVTHLSTQRISGKENILSCVTGSAAAG